MFAPLEEKKALMYSCPLQIDAFFSISIMIDYDMNSKPKLFKRFAVPLFPFINENVGI